MSKRPHLPPFPVPGSVVAVAARRSSAVLLRPSGLECGRPATTVARNGDLHYVEGTVCCAVRRPAGGPVFLLGCHHVFAMSKLLAAVPRNVELLGPPVLGRPPRIARSSGFFGYVDSERFFLDGALLTLEQPALSRRYAAEPTPANGVVSRVIDLASMASIHLADGRRVLVEMYKAWYAYDPGWYPWPVWQKWVIEYHFTTAAQTREGDSGSPVFNASGSAFQGMHIAGNPALGTAFALPAFEILRASHCRIPSGDEQLQLV